MENESISMGFEGEAISSSLNELEGVSEISSDPGGIGEMIDSSFDNPPEIPSFIEELFTDNGKDEQEKIEGDTEEEARADEDTDNMGIESLAESVDELEEKSEESEVGLNEIEAIKEQVERLTNENIGLNDRLGKTEERIGQLIESSYQMAMLLKKLIEGELDKKKKKSMIEILFKIIGDIMRQMMVPDEAQKKVEKRAA